MTTPVDNELFQRIVALRRDLHRHPELAWNETRTAAKVCETLDALGIRYRSGVAGTGVVADLEGAAGAPLVALRADMDALPITEETALEYASDTDGAMHACGHDGHTAMLLGAAELLQRERELPCPVRLIFQPAEETGTGAPAMIEEGALDDVQLVFGGHLDAAYDCGEIVVHQGAVNASTDEFVIELAGPGGHAARPHETVDPIVAGSLIVSALHAIVARSGEPSQAAVVSVGQFDAGTASNIIASRARLRGTLRALEPAVRAQLLDAMRQIAESTAGAQGVSATVEIVAATPAVLNAPQATSLARDAATLVVGPGGVKPLRRPNLGGEDFGFFLERAPGCYVRFGARPEGEGFPAHSSRFRFDEQALALGAAYFYHVAVRAGRTLAEG